MKDHAKIAVEQQLQKTKEDLQHEIQVKDQTVVTLRQQLHQMKEHQSEMKEQAIVSAQQQFDHMKATLEHQIEEKEQARVALEIQIETNNKKREQDIQQKEEEIHTKDREKAELQQQLCQKEELIRSLQQATYSSVAPTSQTEVAEMQHQVSDDDILKNFTVKIVLQFRPTMIIHTQHNKVSSKKK